MCNLSGGTVTEAQKNAYELAKYVSWESLYSEQILHTGQ